MARIVITYPPDYDGELHIEQTDKVIHGLTKQQWTERTYTFTLATKTDDPWADLVSVAKDILAQDARRNAPHTGEDDPSETDTIRG